MGIKRVYIILAVGFLLLSCEGTTLVKSDYADKIVEITVAPDGDVWFGTSNFGIVIYDGNKWKNYRTGNSTLPGNYVSSITFDSKGNAWVGTNGGLVRFEGQNIITYNSTGTSLDTLAISCVAVDHEERIWAGTYGRGLWVFSDDKWKVFTSADKNYNYIVSLTVDSEGKVWVINNVGIFCSVNGGAPAETYYSTEYSLPYSSLTDVLFDELSDIWIASSYGLAHKKDNNWIVIDSTSNIFPRAIVYSICMDSTKNKWITMWNAGIGCYNGSEWKFYNAANSGLVLNDVTDIAADKSGNIWVGTDGKQVCRFNGTSWKTIDIYDF